jgi:MoxR-like ATPase
MGPFRHYKVILSMELLKHVPDQARKSIHGILDECGKVIVGKTDVIEDLLVALLSEGHVLMGGVPGVAKTTIAKTFGRALGFDYRRIQCSPDILPADIVGTHIFNPKTNSFRLERGPIFSNIVLIDEINRNTPKTNSAVLEALQEKQVTIEGETQTLPYPFLVIATQSPIEFHGVFPLPEVLVDRFLLNLKIGYPSVAEELEITDKLYSIEVGEIRQVVTKEQVANLAELTRRVFLAPQVRMYIVDLVNRTREMAEITLGASPRASIALTKASRARALIKGRLYVLPDDVKYLAPKVLSHRIVLSAAERSSLSTENVVASLLEDTPIPQKRS